MVMAYFFGLGLILGSFANAVIWRIKNKKSFVRGRSMCPDCKHQLAAKDLVPVLSWIWLRGKCRYCKKPISVQYPLVELLTGVLFAGIYSMIRPSTPLSWFELVFWLYLAVSFVILAIYDLKWMLIPDLILLPMIVVALLRLPILFFIFHQPFSIIRGPLIAAAVVGALFYSMALLSKGKWMGGGDIKLVFLIGLVLGIQLTSLTMFLATGSAAIVGGILILTKRIKTHYIAFGPFLIAATFIALFYGHHIISLYLGAFGLNSLF